MQREKWQETIAELAEILAVSPDLIAEALQMLKSRTAYRVWTIPKKSGGKRQIQKALWPLNEIQAKIAAVVYPFSISQINHGFVGGRSHRTAILPHLQANAFFAFDIKEAFPSTRKQEVKLSFQKIGFRNQMATLMAQLTCYSSSRNPRVSYLPLGYTSSPIIFNLLLKDIDRMLFSFAQKNAYEVTRYVDNFAFSTTAPFIPERDRKLAIKIVENLSNGQFKIPPEKTAYWEAKENVHFEFLGLVIKGSREGERKIEVADEKLAEYVLTLHDALEKRDFSPKTFKHIQGMIRYLRSVYKKRPLPLEISELYAQYKIMRELDNISKEGQLLLPIPSFQ